MEIPWWQWLVIILLCIFSGLFSGLNLGLMGLDPVGLEVVESGGGENADFARKIKPLRKHGNWLLCTLLFGNVAVNAGLSILLADVSSGLVGFISSTLLIVVFGEIIPQALCSRYALWVGAKTYYLVWFLMAVIALVAWPVSKVLDIALGEELGTIYSNKEMQKLVDIHARAAETNINRDTAEMLKGALGLGEKRVDDVMTAWEEVFYMRAEDKLNFDSLLKVFKKGHSRVPIVKIDEKSSRELVIGLLFVKDLILIDPQDELTVEQVLSSFTHRIPPPIWPDQTLDEVLQLMQKERIHLAVVRDIIDTGKGDPVYKKCGIVTLEDIIEYIISKPIVDEHDVMVDFHEHKNVQTDRLERINWEALSLFDHRRKLLGMPPQELQAVFHHLTNTVKSFSPSRANVSESSLKHLLGQSTVISVNVEDEQRSPYEDIADKGLLLYQKDTETDYFTLVLDGKVEVHAGRQGFRSELSRWSHFCADALDEVLEAHRHVRDAPPYRPDFSAKVIANSRLLRIDLNAFQACLQGQFDEIDFDVGYSAPAVLHLPSRASFRGKELSLEQQVVHLSEGNLMSGENEREVLLHRRDDAEGAAVVIGPAVEEGDEREDQNM